MTKQTGTISESHGNQYEAMRYFNDYGYYMVDCPYCGETNDTELDSENCSCVTCSKSFITGLLEV